MISKVEALALAVGERSLEWFSKRHTLAIESKGPLDLVSQADRDLERMIADGLHSLFPDDALFGEEGSRISGVSGRTWVIDPIDGTFNFVRGGAEWGISIGLYAPSGPISGVVCLPVMGQVFSAGEGGEAHCNAKALPRLGDFDERRACVSVGLGTDMPLEGTLDALSFLLGKSGFSLRACGSCIAGLMEVARGETDAYLGLSEHSWDVMAALPIVLSLGGTCSLNWSGLTLDAKLFFAAGKPAVVARLQPLIDRLFGSSI